MNPELFHDEHTELLGRVVWARQRGYVAWLASGVTLLVAAAMLMLIGRCGRFTDTTDFEDVERGFVGTLDDPVITAADGHVVWDCSKYDFIQGDAPSTANPSLCRQGKLVARHGLFELTGGVYQVRGLDLSNMSRRDRQRRDRDRHAHVE